MRRRCPFAVLAIIVLFASCKPSSEPAYQQGRAALDRKDYDLAIAHFNSVLDRNPNHADAREARGYAYSCLECYADAVADFTEVLRADPSRSKVYLYRGNAYARMGNRERAVADFTELIQLNPEPATVLSEALRLRAATYGAMKRYPEMIADCDRGLSISPREAEFFQMRGRARWLLGQEDLGLEDMRQAKAINPALRDDLYETMERLRQRQR